VLARIGLCVRDLDDWQPVADCVPDLSMRNGKAETWRNRSFPPSIKPAEKRRNQTWKVSSGSDLKEWAL
jgi:hypothetical protein